MDAEGMADHTWAPERNSAPGPDHALRESGVGCSEPPSPKTPGVDTAPAPALSLRVQLMSVAICRRLQRR